MCKFRIWHGFALWLGAVASFSCFAQNDISAPDLVRLKAARSKVQNLIGPLSAVIRSMDKALAEEGTIRLQIPELERQSKAASQARERLERLDQENPGDVSAASLEEKRRDADKAYKNRRAASEKIKAINDKLEVYRAEEAQTRTDFSHAKLEYERLVDQIAARVAAAMRQKLEVPKAVTGEATVACGEISPKACGDRAMSEAERNAAEKGSVIAVESTTVISNYRLSKDTVRSETRGVISNKEVISNEWVGDESKRVRIKATVTPAISPALADELVRSARLGVIEQSGGELDYALVEKTKSVIGYEVVEHARQETERQDRDAQQLEDRKLRADREAKARREAREREELENERRQADGKRQAQETERRAQLERINQANAEAEENRRREEARKAARIIIPGF
jgi:hypothetical protein